MNMINVQDKWCGTVYNCGAMIKWNTYFTT